jgi:hypothetical protein
MKAFIIFLVLFVVTPMADAFDYREFCSAGAGMAESIMKVRQEGIPATQAYGLCHSIGKDSVEEFLFRKLCTEQVADAYKKPRQTNRERQLQEVKAFRDAFHVECIKRYKLRAE